MNCAPFRRLYAPELLYRIASVPIYEFVCENCGRIVERLQKVTDPPPESCPECGGKMAKIMSRNSFQLKGGGWYKDLYSSSSKSDGGGTSKPSSDAPAAGIIPCWRARATGHRMPLVRAA